MDIIKTDKVNFSIAGVNEYADVNATDGEQAIFEFIKSLCPLAEFTRKASGYVSAVYGETDIARFKFTDKAKWVTFPYMANNKKRYIEKIEDLDAFKEDIINSFDFALKTENYNK